MSRGGGGGGGALEQNLVICEGLKPRHCLGKNPKINTLFKTTTSSLLPLLGQPTKCTSSYFKATYWHCTIELNHVVAIAFVFLEYKEISGSK